MACCSLVVFVAVTVICCAVANAKDKFDRAELPEAEYRNHRDVILSDYEPVVIDAVPSVSSGKRNEEYLRMEHERKAALQEFLLHTPEGTRLIGLVVLFLISVFFLQTWSHVARLKRPKTVIKEVTRDYYLPKDGLKPDDVRNYSLKSYEESLPSRYNFNGVQGTAEFILWVYDRIKHTDDIDPRFQEDAIFNLQVGNIITLLDYDWFVYQYSQFRISTGEIKQIVEALRNDDFLFRERDAILTRLEKGEPEEKKTVKSRIDTLGELEDPFEVSCM